MNIAAAAIPAKVACKQEHGYPVGKGGIHLNEIMTTLPDGRLRIDYIPSLPLIAISVRLELGEEKNLPASSTVKLR